MLRKLEKKDIDGMLEWMHEPEINRFYRFDAESMTYENAAAFIEKKDDHSRHYAVVDGSDEYLGTISLKDIDKVNRKAEYAIALRSCAHGTGVAASATDEVLKIAFDELGLNKVFLNVLADNGRARRFYEKYGFIYEGTFRQDVLIRGEYHDLSWYSILSKDNGR